MKVKAGIAKFSSELRFTLRLLILSFLGVIRPKWFKQVKHRAIITEVGFSGYGPTLFDLEIAQKENLKPLKKWEKWLLQPFIQIHQDARKKASRQAYLEVLGEDPYENPFGL
jgi:hypothetical protein